AIEGVNGKVVDGRTLAVDWSVEKGAYQGMQEKADDEADIEAEKTEAVAEVTDGQDDAEFGDQLEDVESDEDENESAEEDDEEDEVGVKVDGDDEVDEMASKAGRLPEDKSSTLFVRNLPFTCSDEDLEDHFRQFGNVRYARVVVDQSTDRSKGTGFVCFYDTADADTCLRSAPRRALPTEAGSDHRQAQTSKSILQNENTDPTGQHTLDGRVLQVSRAVNKSEAGRLTEEGATYRSKRDKDKRRLYLLSEGTISTKSKLWDQLPPSERTMREASVKQRKTLIESNPSLNLSLARLSVRNIPRSIGSKELKALAREAVVGFATDLKNGLREKLSREELERGGEEMRAAEIERKRAGKGIVRQAKVVFEGAGGSKVSEETGAGRSRGYGFIEYYTHRSALMGLRWLNGHAVGYRVQESGKGSKGKVSVDDLQDRKKRLVVEFAIENAQVVMRRSEREGKAQERSRAFKAGAAVDGEKGEVETGRPGGASGRPRGLRDARQVPQGQLGKRKRGAEAGKPSSRTGKDARPGNGPAKNGRAQAESKTPIDEKTTKRNQIIGRKRAARKVRKGGKA
ncbi:RNA recognition motif-containing protein, partial [Teratosphaeriaceae sp. CCFEE 6253]